jgi:hypothetical protein
MAAVGANAQIIPLPNYHIKIPFMNKSLLWLFRSLQILCIVLWFVFSPDTNLGFNIIMPTINNLAYYNVILPFINIINAIIFIGLIYIIHKIKLHLKLINEKSYF